MDNIYRIEKIHCLIALRPHTAYKIQGLINTRWHISRFRESASKWDNPPFAGFTYPCGFLNEEKEAADLVLLHKVGCFFENTNFHIRCRGPPSLLNC